MMTAFDPEQVLSSSEPNEHVIENRVSEANGCTLSVPAQSFMTEQTDSALVRLAWLLQGTASSFLRKSEKEIHRHRQNRPSHCIV